MTRNDQAKFIRSLCRSIEKDVTASIKKTPETESWDGHELRVLLAKHFEKEATWTLVNRNPRSQRARDFRNVLATSNLL